MRVMNILFKGVCNDCRPRRIGMSAARKMSILMNSTSSISSQDHPHFAWGLNKSTANEFGGECSGLFVHFKYRPGMEIISIFPQKTTHN